MKWLETVNGYVAVDDAKRFTISYIWDAVKILMWVDDNADNCIVVKEYNADAVSDAKRELEFIINYISDGDVCTYSEYRQHKDVCYGSCTATNHSNKRKRGEKQCVNIDPSV